MKGKLLAGKKYRRTPKRRTLAIALTLLMIASILPLQVFADAGGASLYPCGHICLDGGECGFTADSPGTACDHGHDGNCGYVEGSPCNDKHEHDGSCGYTAAADEIPCDKNCLDLNPATFEHAAGCVYTPAVDEIPCDRGCLNLDPATLEHTANCAYTPTSPGSPCTYSHSHDESCGLEGAECTLSHEHGGSCGYTAAADEIPCDQGCLNLDPAALEHAADCAYTPAVAEIPCDSDCLNTNSAVSEHAEGCAYTAASPGSPCTYSHSHDESCGFSPGTACGHNCAAGNCAFVSPLAGQSCTHRCQITAFKDHIPGAALASATAAAGDSHDQIAAVLPPALTGYLACIAGAEDTAAEISVTWHCQAYDPETTGTYNFYALLDEEIAGYTVADDPQTTDIDESSTSPYCDLPYIAVTTEEAATDPAGGGGGGCLCDPIPEEDGEHTNPDCPLYVQPVSTLGYINADETPLYAEANSESTVLAILAKNTPVTIMSAADGWMQVSCEIEGTGYMGYTASETVTPGQINIIVPLLGTRTLAPLLTEKGDMISISGLLPENAYITAEVVEFSVAKDLVGAESEAEILFAYDIKIMVPAETEGGEPTECQPTTPVIVSITPPEDKPIEAPVTVTHVSEDADTGETTTQIVAAAAAPVDGTVEFAAESFSIYIGTTPPGVVDASDIWYNGANFFLDEDCTTGNILNDSTGEPFTDLQALLNAAGSDLTIYMKAAYDVTDTQFISGGTAYDITLKRWADSENYNASNADTFYGDALITVGSAGNLTLTNITLDGGAVWNGPENATLGRGTTNAGITASASLVMITSGGAFTLNDGSVLQNNDATGEPFRLGGGVYAQSHCTIAISGGIIRNNVAYCGAALVLDDINNRVQMTGGLVAGNYATAQGGGFYGSFDLLSISGGTLRNNVAHTDGGAICVFGGIVNISGGLITNNESELSIGGGAIYSIGGTIELSGSAVLSNNNAQKNGGAIVLRSYKNSSPVLNVRGGNITENTATTGNGIATVIDSDSSGCPIINISGGVIINADNATTDVYAAEGSRLTVTGGTIKTISGNAPTNGASPVYLNTITLAGVTRETAVTQITQNLDYPYGCNDVHTDAEGKLYFWMPENAVTSWVHTGNNHYSGSITSLANGSAAATFTASNPVYVNSGLETGENNGTTAVNAFRTFAAALAEAEATANTYGAATIVVCGPTEIGTMQAIAENITITSVVGTSDYRNGAYSAATPNAGAMLKRGSDYGGYLIENNGTLTLSNLTIDGGAVWTGGTPYTYNANTRTATLSTNSGITASHALIHNTTAGQLTVQGGAVLRNNHNNNGDTGGGAIFDDAEEGKSSRLVFITGGSIRNNAVTGTNTGTQGRGGGICSKGTVYMIGGSIENNAVQYHGGGVFIAGDGNADRKLLLMGGSISANAVLNESVQYGGGAGVCVAGGTNNSRAQMAMSGGLITGNHSNGNGGGVRIFASSHGAVMTGGEISGNTAKVNGSAIQLNGELTYSGGIISGSEAADRSSVYLDKAGSLFTIADGAVVDIRDKIHLGLTTTDGGTETGTQTQPIAVAGSFTVAMETWRVAVDISTTVEGTSVVDYASDISDTQLDVELAKFRVVNPGCMLAQSTDDPSQLVIATNLGAIYVGGENASDLNGGLSPLNAVATLKKAYEIADEDTVMSDIYICGAIAVTTNMTLTNQSYEYSDGTVELEKPVELLRYAKVESLHPSWPASYTGALFDVTGGELTLSNILIGGNHYGVNAQSAMITVASGATLNVGAGAQLISNYNSGNGGAVYVSGGTVNMSGGEMTENYAHNGGGIYAANGAAVNMSGGSLLLNSASQNGGAIYSAEGCKLTMSGGSISANSITGAATGTKSGGGVYSAGKVMIRGGEISGNASPDLGGGLHIDKGGSFTLYAGIISGNEARFAGGMYCHGAFLMSGGVISDNRATEKTGGGLVFNTNEDNETPTIKAELSGGTITRNSAVGSAGGVRLYSKLTMTGGTISNNSSGGHGGGVYVDYDTRHISGMLDMRGGVISNNSSGGHGGGVYYVGNFSMSGGEISGNEAINGGGGICSHPVATTSAALISGDALISRNTAANGGGLNARVEMTGGTVMGNTATNNGGGMVVSYGSSILGGKITGNTAQYGGGGIYNFSGETSAYTLTVSSCIISGNTAHIGGGLYNNGYSTLLIEDGAVIRGNTAYGGGGIYTTTLASAVGDATCYIGGGLICENTATNGGGLRTDGRLVMTGGRISGNTATDGAGGIYVYTTGTANISGGTVGGAAAYDAQAADKTDMGNYATNNGGGVYVNGALTMSGGEISHNHASGAYGGGVCVYGTGALFTMEGGGITNNTMPLSASGGPNHHGGGLCVNMGASATVSGGSIAGNEAMFGAGIFAWNNAKLNVTGGNVSGNYAETSGGAIHVQANAVCTLSDTSITGNTCAVSATSGVAVINSSADDGTVLLLRHSPTLTDGIYLNYAVICVVNGDGTAAFSPNTPIPVSTSPNTAGLTVARYYTSYTDGTDNTPSSSASLEHLYMTDPSLSLVRDATKAHMLKIAAASNRVQYVTTYSQGIVNNDGKTPQTPTTFSGAYRNLANGGGTIYVMGSSVCGTTGTVGNPWILSGTQYYNGSDHYDITNGTVNIVRYADYNGALLSVPNNGALALENIVIDGNRANVTAQNALVDVAEGGTLIVRDGAVLRNNKNQSGTGGAIISNGAVQMSGGLISGNSSVSGGGIYAAGDGMTLSGGLISSNRAGGETLTDSNGGGGIYAASGTQITMTGGTVSGNTTNFGGGIAVIGATFTMSGGTVTGNTQERYGAIYTNGGKLNIQGQAEITDNRAVGAAMGGGGLAAHDGTINITGTPVITGNRAAAGGNGIWLNNDNVLCNVSGNPNFGSDQAVYLKGVSKITIPAAYNGSPLSVEGEGMAPGRVIAVYSSELAPDPGQFAVRTQLSARVSGQNIVLGLDGTLTAAAEDVLLGAGQSRIYTLDLADFFGDSVAGKNINITSVTATSSGAGNTFTHEAYNTVYQNRRDYGYTKSNTTFGLSASLDGGAELDTLGGASLGTGAAGSTLAFRLYNANAITSAGVAGTFIVRISDGSNAYDLLLAVDRIINIQFSVTVPISITGTVNAAGQFTLPTGDTYSILNSSLFPVQVDSVEWQWQTAGNADADELFQNYLAVTPRLRFGSNQMSYVFNSADLVQSPGTDGYIIAHNGLIPGRLPLNWTIDTLTNNWFKHIETTHIATIVYTISAANDLPLQ